MADETKSNLEPIEEGDLNTREKFIGGSATENKLEEKKEIPHSIEGQVERKEGVAEKEVSYSKIISKIKPQKKPVHADDDVASDAEVASEGIDAENKISNLVDLAQAKGVTHAVKVARHMEDNYTLDEFHDRLLGEELHDALVKKGIIKEI